MLVLLQLVATGAPHDRLDWTVTSVLYSILGAAVTAMKLTSTAHPTVQSSHHVTLCNQANKASRMHNGCCFSSVRLQHLTHNMTPVTQAQHCRRCWRRGCLLFQVEASKQPYAAAPVTTPRPWHTPFTPYSCIIHARGQHRQKTTRQMMLVAVLCKDSRTADSRQVRLSLNLCAPAALVDKIRTTF